MHEESYIFLLNFFYLNFFVLVKNNFTFEILNTLFLTIPDTKTIHGNVYYVGSYMNQSGQVW